MGDRSAFLFSLTDGHEREALKLPIVAHVGFAVGHYRDRGPLFGVGAGSDLGLNLDEAKLGHCRSSVGTTYAIPRASAKDPVVSDTFMAGKLDGWDIDDIVVYHAVDRKEPNALKGALLGAMGAKPEDIPRNLSTSAEESEGGQKSDAPETATGTDASRGGLETASAGAGPSTG